MNSILDPADEIHLLRAIDLAKLARKSGEQPFGSLLVGPDGETIGESYNTVLSDSDVTAHPELKLARLAGTLPERVARASTLFTSCEPCGMCTEALARGRVGRVVFALSAAQLRSLQEQPPQRPAPVSMGPALQSQAEDAIGDHYR